MDGDRPRGPRRGARMARGRCVGRGHDGRSDLVAAAADGHRPDGAGFEDCALRRHDVRGAAKEPRRAATDGRSTFALTCRTWRGTGEGGLQYFYDQQWKRFFQTVPRRYHLTVDGRPVVFMWHGGFEWYARQNFFHALIDALRDATRRDFGVDPFVIVEESWTRLDPAVRVDGVYDWFEPGRSFATLMTWNGFRVGQLVPGFDCTPCGPQRPKILRQDGKLYQAGLAAVAPGADLVLIDGIDNRDENAHLLETECLGPVVSRDHEMVRRECPVTVPRPELHRVSGARSASQILLLEEVHRRW